MQVYRSVSAATNRCEVCGEPPAAYKLDDSNIVGSSVDLCETCLLALAAKCIDAVVEARR